MFINLTAYTKGEINNDWTRYRVFYVDDFWTHVSRNSRERKIIHSRYYLTM